MSDTAICASCRRPNPTRQCGVCEGAVCKSCVQNLEPSTFALLPEVPKELSHTYYCQACYDEHVATELERYTEILARAEEAFIFFTSQKAFIPLIVKSKEIFRVANIPDRDEAILRLAFLAARKDFNAVMEVEVVGEKVRDGAYQTMKWRAQGHPAKVDVDKMDRR
jgi:hypothetical protein